LGERPRVQALRAKSETEDSFIENQLYGKTTIAGFAGKGGIC
jgi:hypothetical protein